MSIRIEEMPVRYKDPQAKLDYPFRWHLWLAAGETIASATVTIETGLNRDPAHPVDTINDTEVIVWLAGGTLAESYIVTCHIVTNQGREDDRSARIVIRNR